MDKQGYKSLPVTIRARPKGTPTQVSFESQWEALVIQSCNQANIDAIWFITGICKNGNQGSPANTSDTQKFLTTR